MENVLGYAPRTTHYVLIPLVQDGTCCFRLFRKVARHDRGQMGWGVWVGGEQLERELARLAQVWMALLSWQFG